MVNNDRIWNFTGEKKTLDGIYNKFKKLKTIKMGAKIGLNRTTMQELDRTQKRSLTGQ